MRKRDRGTWESPEPECWRLRALDKLEPHEQTFWLLELLTEPKFSWSSSHTFTNDKGQFCPKSFRSPILFFYFQKNLQLDVSKTGREKTCFLFSHLSKRTCLRERVDSLRRMIMIHPDVFYWLYDGLQGGQPADILMEVTVPVIKQSKCRKQTRWGMLWIRPLIGQ